MRNRARTSAIAAVLLMGAACAGGPDPAALGTREPTPPAADHEAAEQPEDAATSAPDPVLEVSLEGLPDATPDAYVLWVVGAQGPVALGRVDGGAPVTVPAPAAGVEDGAELLVSLETAGGDLPAAPGPVVLAGEVEGDAAALSPGHELALGTDFAEAEGTYLLGTPTDPPAPETSGIWFLVLEPRGPSLVLPDLPDGWAYEGRVTIGDVPLPTGRFHRADAPDDDASFSGPESGPPFPGEDFLRAAPEGLTFPVDLSGAPVAVVAVPVGRAVGGSAGIAVLSGQVPEPAADHTSFPLERVDAPRGTVRVER